MRPLNFPVSSSAFANLSGYSRTVPRLKSTQAAQQMAAADTVHFGASSSEADRTFLETFFKENPCRTEAANVLAPPTRREKVTGLAFEKYCEGVKKGQRPFLPRGYQESMVDDGYLKADNKSWDVERSAFRRYVLEVLFKDKSDEKKKEALRQAGFKANSKHKKASKPSSQLEPSEISAPKTQELKPEVMEAEASSVAQSETLSESLTDTPEQPKTRKIWSTGFDWADDAEEAPAFVEAAKAAAARNAAKTPSIFVEAPKSESTKTEVVQSAPRSGFGDALKELMMNRKSSNFRSY